MNASDRQAILTQQKPTRVWHGEPYFGSEYGAEEIDAVVATMRRCMDPEVGFSGGEEIAEFEERFAAFCGVEHAVSVNSAGVGLDLAMMCLDLEPGDEVICPTINFKAAPLSIAGQGGQWIPCESHPRSFQMDPVDAESRITPRTRALYPVHMNGCSAPMDELLAVAARHEHPKHGPIKVIGDAARACGGGYKDGKIGALGWCTVFSFHTMKNMVTLGEGGMVVTNDADLAARMRRIRFFGADVEWGSSYLMNRVQAALGSVQVGRLEALVDRRRALAHARDRMLAGLDAILTPYEPDECRHSYYLYTLLVRPELGGEWRDRLRALLQERHGVETIVANPPVHSTSEFLRRHTGNRPLPIAEEIGRRLFCLPIAPTMTDAENEYLCAALWDAVEVLGAPAASAG